MTTSTANAHDSLLSDIEKGLDRARALRDEIRVQIHLAGMDAKDEWSKLDTRLFEVEGVAKSISSTSRTAVLDAVRELELLLTKLAKSVPGGM